VFPYEIGSVQGGIKQSERIARRAFAQDLLPSASEGESR
jgi:hypothetical protein